MEFTRFPNHAKFQEVLKQLGMAVTAPSPEIYESRVINFSKKVEPATAYTLDDLYFYAERDGFISNVLFYFPPGCNNLVRIRVGVGNKQVFPGEGFFYADGYGDNVTVYKKFKQNDRIWAEIYNYDETYDHDITLVVFINYTK